MRYICNVLTRGQHVAGQLCYVMFNSVFSYIHCTNASNYLYRLCYGCYSSSSSSFCSLLQSRLPSECDNYYKFWCNVIISVCAWPLPVHNQQQLKMMITLKYKNWYKRKSFQNVELWKQCCWRITVTVRQCIVWLDVIFSNWVFLSWLLCYFLIIHCNSSWPVMYSNSGWSWTWQWVDERCL